MPVSNPAAGFSVGPDHDITCDGVSLAAIATEVGTPVYVYSASLLRERFRDLDRAFGGYPHTIHYALKANSTLALVRILRALGCAADANSIWEIEVARAAGFDPSQIVFTGVGKTRDELERAVALGVKAINVESAGELSRIDEIATRLDRVVRVAVRLNPDIDAESHAYISTGLRINKFGVAQEAFDELFASFRERPRLKLVGVHVHVGSQITTVAPLRRAAAFVSAVSRALIDRGARLEYVDLGGGLGVSYDGGPVPSAAEYVSALREEVEPIGLPIVIEPGRWLAAPAGVLVARVIDLKPRDHSSEFAIIDAGMTDLLRPALYDAFHQIEPVRQKVGSPGSTPTRTYEVAGPVCETSDVIGRSRSLPRLDVGDLVAIRDVGAYGSVMASNYNRRPLAPEVVVDEGSWRVIRRRQTVDDMLSLET